MDKGLVHIYCGDGKGKTTAAVGLAARVAGCGLHVVFAQFLKDNRSSERATLASLDNVTLLDGPDSVKFVKAMTEEEFAAAKQYFGAMFERCLALSRSDEVDVLIMDEIIGAVRNGVIDEQALVSLILGRANGVELVMTGRGPSQAILDLADYVTEMKLVKHPFQGGVTARRGIEF